MKTNILLTTFFLSLSVGMQAQNEKITPSVERVTVFMNGAQVERSKSVNLLAGEQTITFTGISPYTDTKSMQVKARGRITVLGVNYRTSHPDSLQRVQQLRDAQRRVKATAGKRKELEAQHEVVTAQLELVKTNCSVGNRTAVTPLAGIKELNNYYQQELLALKKRLISIDEELAATDEELQRREHTADSIGKLKLKTVTDVEVKVMAQQAGRADFTLVYYVRNAGWFPSYDVRADGITKPLQLSYKANVFQNTREDWRNVPVTLSSANPSRSTIAPDLRTYWLDYGIRAPRYEGEDLFTGSVSGRVVDEQGEPLIGASVQVVGTQLGAVTDMDGHYSITLPRDRHQLRFAYIGYETRSMTANGSVLNVVLKEDKAAIQEVTVVGYGLSGKQRRASKNRMEDKAAEAIVPHVKAVAEPLPESEVIDVSEQHAQFGYEFNIGQPLTLLSDGKTTTTEIGRYELPAEYQYRGVPRADKDAFLVAETTGWQQLSLLEGEANIYFENSFVGKSIIDPTAPTDTLRFSLGRDNGLRITRTKVADRSTRRMLASTQEQTMAWRIVVKNTRKEAVSLMLQDQVPVSRNSNITVSTEELSNGQYDRERGIVSWQLQLQPGEQRELYVQYRVKYPKNRHLVIE